MNKGFILEDNYGYLIERKRARGYKYVEIDKSVKAPCMVSISTKDLDKEPKLLIKASNSKTKEPIYMFLCKEFGLSGYNANFENKISVIFCDNGLMLVTLHKGALSLRTNGELNLFVVDNEEIPSFERDNICWFDANKLKSYVAYYKLQSKYVYDFEFMFSISAGTNARLSSVRVKHLEEEDIDMSLGAYAIELESNTDMKETQEKIEQEQKKQKALDKYFNRKKG